MSERSTGSDRPATSDRLSLDDVRTASTPGRPGDTRHETRGRQRRVLLFVNDGAGLGHLARMARLAGALQGPCAALVVTGHRAASTFVPSACEFVHIPGIDSLHRSQARYWNREPFLQVRPDEASRLRMQILRAVVDSFAPDAILVDHLPAGRTGELHAILAASSARKYLVLRGLIGPSPIERALIFEGAGGALLADAYSRIFVACDPRIVNLAAEYRLPDAITNKLLYTGYIVPAVTGDERAAVRYERSLLSGVSSASPWIVCSAGGGMLGETFVQQCLALADSMADARFDVVYGPRSADPWPWRGTTEVMRGRVRLIQSTPYLARLHASCDLLVCSGGYNSIVEAMAGATPIVARPVQTLAEDEQALQARRLAEFYPVTRVEGADAGSLESAVRSALTRLDADRARARETTLARDGLHVIRERLCEDLNVSITEFSRPAAAAAVS
jgi:predicted glycosyltransferase